MGIIAALLVVFAFGFSFGYTFCELRRIWEETKGNRARWEK
jgi:hypothetical protein